MHSIPRGTRAATPAELADLAELQPTDAAWDAIYAAWPEPNPDAWDTRFPMVWPPPEPEPLGPTEQDWEEMHAAGEWTRDYDEHDA